MVPDLSQTQLSRRKLLKGGVTSLALLLAGGGYYQFSVNRPDYYSATGTVEAAVLPDGSKLRLSSASSVSVHFTEQKRLVKLIAGEVFFDVAPDSARPFTVSATHVNTTALGTAFSVRHEDDGVSVVVTEHSVRVETPSQSVQVEERYAVRSRGNNLGMPMPPMNRLRLISPVLPLACRQVIITSFQMALLQVLKRIFQSRHFQAIKQPIQLNPQIIKTAPSSQCRIISMMSRLPPRQNLATPSTGCLFTARAV